MLTNWSKFQNRNVQTFGFVDHDTNGVSHGPVWKIQSFLLSEICMVILGQDYYGKGHLRKSCYNTVGRRFQIGKVSLYTVKKGYSYLCMWMNIKLAGNKQNIDPMWKVLNKEVDLGERTSFLWSCVLGMYSKTMWNEQRYCWLLQNHVRIQNFSRSNWKHYHARKIWVSLRGPMTWKVMPRNVWNDIVSWQTGRLNNSTKYPLHALMTIISKKKNWNPWGDLSNVCSQIVLKCLYLARIGRPDILCSVNKHARSITKWTKACDKRLCRLISYISSYMWIQSVLPRGEHCQTMQTGIVSRLRFCRRS